MRFGNDLLAPSSRLASRLLVAGGMLQWLGNVTPLFIFADVMHPLAWIAIRALVGSTSTRVSGQRKAPRSSRWAWARGRGRHPGRARLRELELYPVGDKNSVAAAASLLALIGLALVYASREVRLGAAR